MTLRYVHGAQYAIDASGEMIPGSKLYFYLAGTSQATPQDVFSDSARNTPISQPVLADASGRWPDIFMDDEIYDVVWKDASGATVDTFLNWDAGLSSALGTGTALAVNQGGTSATTAAAARTNLGVASQAGLTTATNDIATLRTQVDTGLNGDDEFGALAPLDTVARTVLASGFGSILLQRTRSTTLSASSTTASIPNDTSKPQIGEGTKIFDVSFTPLSTTSTVRINVRMYSSNSGTNDNVFALFKNSGADAVSASAYHTENANATREVNFSYEESPASVSAIGYTVRAGTGGGTLTINGTNTLGGVMLSSISIEEWEAH